jgi:hypothetical protein
MAAVGCCSILALTEPGQAQVTAEELTRLASQQNQLNEIRIDLREREAAARAALARGDCVAFRRLVGELDEAQGAFYPLGDQPPETRRAVRAQVRQLHETLSAEPCPPGTTGTAFTGLRNFHIGGGVSSTQGIQVGNGNFNTDLNATGPAVEAGVSVPLPPGTFGPRSTFQGRFFYFNGDGSTNLNGNAGTFLQANGLNQPINLNATGKTSTDLTHVGGEVLLRSDHPLHHFGAIFSPLFGAGFERVTMDTNTTANIAPLNFFASDSRTTVTDRLFITGGLQAEFPALGNFPGAPTIVVFGNGRINFDHVTGTARYHTRQAFVFEEFLQNQFSRNVVTFGGEAGAGLGWNFANGGRFQIKGSVGSVPLHELKFHAGQPATLEHSNHLNLAGGASLNIPLTGPRPYDVEDVLRNVTFR